MMRHHSPFLSKSLGALCVVACVGFHVVPALAQTSAPPLLRVTPEGKVGIGLAAPVHALDVRGDINLTGCVRINGVQVSGMGTCVSGNLQGALPPVTSTPTGDKNAQLVAALDKEVAAKLALSAAIASTKNAIDTLAQAKVKAATAATNFPAAKSASDAAAADAKIANDAAVLIERQVSGFGPFVPPALQTEAKRLRALATQAELKSVELQKLTAQAAAEIQNTTLAVNAAMAAVDAAQKAEAIAKQNADAATAARILLASR